MKNSAWPVLALLMCASCGGSETRGRETAGTGRGTGTTGSGTSVSVTYKVSGFGDATPIEKTVAIAGPRIDVSLR